MLYDEAIVRRFWANVAICHHGYDCPYCCWPWQGTRWLGYGQMSVYDTARYKAIGYASRTLKANRLAIEIHNNARIPPGLWALHRCNNRACCNFDPLYMGTPRDNARDSILAGTHITTRPELMAQRGHWPQLYPERIATSHLIRHSWAVIEEMRALSRQGVTQSAIAAMFGTTPSYVWRIVHRKVRVNH
jgi:hypothetical protein